MKRDKQRGINQWRCRYDGTQTLSFYQEKSKNRLNVAQTLLGQAISEP